MLAHLSSNLSEFLSRYHLKDVIVGKIYFLLVRIKIKHMELAIIKRETTGTGRSFIVIYYDLDRFAYFNSIANTAVGRQVVRYTVGVPAYCNRSHLFCWCTMYES